MSYDQTLGMHQLTASKTFFAASSGLPLTNLGIATAKSAPFLPVPHISCLSKAISSALSFHLQSLEYQLTRIYTRKDLSDVQPPRISYQLRHYDPRAIKDIPRWVGPWNS